MRVRPQWKDLLLTYDFTGELIRRHISVEFPWCQTWLYPAKWFSVCHMRTSRWTDAEKLTGLCLQNFAANTLRRIYSKLKRMALTEDRVIDIEWSYFWLWMRRDVTLLLRSFWLKARGRAECRSVFKHCVRCTVSVSVPTLCEVHSVGTQSVILT